MNRKERLELFKSKGFTYDPESGEVFSHTGKLCTAVSSTGYKNCGTTIDGKKIGVSCHQLAWYLMTNEIPDIIDHIDGDRSNNKFSNLRSITKRKNNFNRKNVKGYDYHKGRNKCWCARIEVDGKRINLGYFYTEEEAKQAYLDAKKIYHII